MATLPTLAAATSVLTSTGAFTDTQTVTCGGKTYTTQTSLTNVDGNVAIGANQTATHQNLMDAINLTGTPGTQYAAAMTRNKLVKATLADGTHTNIAAKIKGVIGNQFATTETQTNASWTSTVMANGSGDSIEALDDIQDYMQVNSEVQAALSNCLNLASTD